MAKEKFERTKPHVNIGTIGHVDHGKTTLTAAITSVMALERAGGVLGLRGHRQGAGRAGTRHHHRDGPRGVRDGEPSLRPRRLPRSRRLREEHDHGCGADGRRVSWWFRPPTARCRRRVSTSCSPVRWACRRLVVFLNKCDMVEDEELLELVEMELRELLSQYEFPGDDIPIIRGSALKALEAGNADDEWGREDHRADGLRWITSFLEPVRDVDKDFLMPIEDIFTIQGRGTVVTGRIERGVVKVGETIEIVGIRDTSSTVVTGVEMFRKLLDRGAGRRQRRNACSVVRRKTTWSVVRSWRSRARSLPTPSSMARCMC